MRKLTLYSKDGCPFCSLLKMELGKRGFEFTEIDLSDDSERAQFYEETGLSTVPQLYAGGPDHENEDFSVRRLGGWSEVSKNWELLETMR